MRRFAYEPTVKHHVGDLRRKRVLDLACGEGVSSRMMRELGATEVIGVDLSEELIRKARQKGGEIRYLVRDCINGDLSELGNFDAVTAIMLLHYAESENQLRGAIRNIHRTLVPKGVCSALIVNPDTLETGYENYGIRLSRAKSEGEPVLTELHDFNWDKFCEFTDYAWRRETYDRIFQEEGFETEWLPGIVSKEGVQEYGEEFWKDYLENPIYMMIKAKKVKIDIIY